MNSTQFQILPLREAADRFQAENIESFRQGMKKAGCIVTIGGVELVDMGKLQAKAARKSQGNGKSNGGGSTKRSADQQVGLLKARVKMYPQWIKGKEEAVASMRIERDAASTPYDRGQAEKKLHKLQAALERMQENQDNDATRLAAILNAGIAPISES